MRGTPSHAVEVLMVRSSWTPSCPSVCLLLAREMPRPLLPVADLRGQEHQTPTVHFSWLGAGAALGASPPFPRGAGVTRCSIIQRSEVTRTLQPQACSLSHHTRPPAWQMRAPAPQALCGAHPRWPTEKGHPLHQVQGQHALLFRFCGPFPNSGTEGNVGPAPPAGKQPPRWP